MERDMDPGTTAMACAEVEDHLEDLAFGDLAEPDRSRMLAHVTTCRACRDRLDALLTLSDQLLLLAPQHEPPPGFETRVLERLGASASAVSPTTNAGSSVRTLPLARRAWLGAAAALLLVALSVAAVALLRGDRSSGSDRVAAVRSGVIVNGAGLRTGSIRLVDDEHPYVLVTIDHPQQRNQEVYCQLVLADGRTVTVGSWGYDDVRANVWAVGIDAELLDAVTMHVVTEDGAIVATAALAEA